MSMERPEITIERNIVQTYISWNHSECGYCTIMLSPDGHVWSQTGFNIPNGADPAYDYESIDLTMYICEAQNAAAERNPQKYRFIDPQDVPPTKAMILEAAETAMTEFFCSD